MISDEFISEVLVPVQRHLRRRVAVPGEGVWGLEAANDALVLTLRTSAQALAGNLQTNAAATPTFLLCLAFWLDQALGRKVRCQLQIDSPVPTSESELRHWRRSIFVVEQFAALLPERFRATAPGCWEWPADPALNLSSAKRSIGEPDKASEHALELSLCNNPTAAATFPHPILLPSRQLPVGLFNGDPTAAGQWTPAGKSQVDLWALSPDLSTVHLFELKAQGNAPLGMLPEAFYYARLLHFVQLGLPNGERIRVAGKAMESISRARTLRMWLAAPNFHPLLGSASCTPLSWLNEKMNAEGVSLGFMPIEVDSSGHWLRWGGKSCPGSGLIE